MLSIMPWVVWYCNTKLRGTLDRQGVSFCSSFFGIKNNRHISTKIEEKIGKISSIIQKFSAPLTGYIQLKHSILFTPQQNIKATDLEVLTELLCSFQFDLVFGSRVRQHCHIAAIRVHLCMRIPWTPSCHGCHHLSITYSRDPGNHSYSHFELNNTRMGPLQSFTFITNFFMSVHGLCGNIASGYFIFETFYQ